MHHSSPRMLKASQTFATYQVQHRLFRWALRALSRVAPTCLRGLPPSHQHILFSSQLRLPRVYLTSVAGPPSSPTTDPPAQSSAYYKPAFKAWLKWHVPQEMIQRISSVPGFSSHLDMTVPFTPRSRSSTVGRRCQPSDTSCEIRG